MDEQKKISIDSVVYDEKKLEQCLLEVGVRIRHERIRKNLSISKLAELSNLSVSCISKAEANQCGISLKALLKIAAALDVKVWKLMEQKEPAQTGNRDAGWQEPDGRKRFEQITGRADEETVGFILDMAEQLLSIMEKEG